MANIAVGTPDLSDAATLTAEGTVSSTLPLANLQDKQPSKVARWTSLTGIRLKVDLGASYDIALVALLFMNLSTDGLMRIVIAATEAALDGSNPALDTGWFAPSETGATQVGTVAGRWVSIEIDDPTNSDGYFEAGRLYICADGLTWWQPEVNAAAGAQLGLEDDSQVDVALSGGLLPTERHQRRVVTYPFECQSRAELYGGAFPIMQARGLHSDLLVIEDPEDADFLALRTLYGLMTQLAPLQHREADLWGWTLTVREMI